MNTGCVAGTLLGANSAKKKGKKQPQGLSLPVSGPGHGAGGEMKEALWLHSVAAFSLLAALQHSHCSQPELVVNLLGERAPQTGA